MKIVFSCLICLFALGVNAQPGLTEMRQVKEDLTDSFFSVVDFSLVLAGIFGILGALRIYHNWQMGKDSISIEVSAWFFSALFMILSSIFLRAFALR